MTFYEIGLEDEEREALRRLIVTEGRPLTEAAAITMLVRRGLAGQADGREIEAKAA